jgi:hypothetical protein
MLRRIAERGIRRGASAGDDTALAEETLRILYQRKASREETGRDEEHYLEGTPPSNTVRLDELDVICAVLGCGVEELLLPEPETVPQPEPADGEQAPAVAEARPVTPRPRGGRSLPPR